MKRLKSAFRSFNGLVTCQTLSPGFLCRLRSRSNLGRDSFWCNPFHFCTASNWKLGRIVALKLIRKDLLTNATVAARFRREIETTTQLDHPNLIRAFDADETDEGLFVLASVVDISARQRAEARFRAAVESSPNGMVMVESRGQIVLVNREIERLFGYTREELLGQPIELLVPQQVHARHPGLRTDFFARPQTRAMGAGRDHGARACAIDS